MSHGKNFIHLRWLAVDPGTKRLGLAVWSPSSQMARPLSPLKRKTLKQDVNTLRKILEDEQIEGFVLGWPLSLSGRETSSTQTAAFWKETLEKEFSLPVFCQDEALSSQQALDDLKELKVKRKKEKIDSVAAALILEDFIRAKKEEI